MRLLVVVLLVALVGCTRDGSPPARERRVESPYRVDEASLPFEALPGTATERRWGVNRQAGYRIEVPDAWNGELVLYAHGFAGFGPALQVADPPFREHLIRRGFAWAASSYRSNGYAVEDGIEDTEALRQLFAREFRRPGRTYLTGSSMGGHITAAAVERRPRAYDGALVLCGVLGDVELFDWYLDHAVVAAALAGVEAAHPPPPDYLSATAPDVEAALGYGPGRSLSESGRQLAAAAELLSGGERPLFDEAFTFWSGEATAILGHPFLLAVYGGALSAGAVGGPGEGDADPLATAADNLGTVYRLDTDPATSEAEARLNASVTRTARRDAPPFPVVRGEPPVNVVALHGLGDLFVPLSMTQAYAAEAAASGAADRLVVRAVRDVTHCGFTAAETAAAFDDLVAWVRDGRRPEGDDVLDPETVAAPGFGCRFTAEARPGLPPCPPDDPA